MNKSVVFLESAIKKKTIETFLGKDYVIFATGGHLTELVKKGYYNLGVDLEKFTPTYEIIPEKKKLIDFWKSFLRQEKIQTIYLATDPDREGEAIAKQVVKILNLVPSQHQRLFFYEITPRSIREALSNPLVINENLVEAQISRQVLDRMVGFCLSTVLQKKLQALSAGRVQSVVLKLIVERELAIRNHEKKKEYIVCGICLIEQEKITLKQVKSTGELIVYPEIPEAEKVVAKLGLDFQLLNKKEEDKVVLPKPPLTTSLLLFEAKSQLGFSISQTTQLAQKLYEGVRLISSEKQDAHEAIHPTYLNYHPDDEEIKISLTKEEHQLYQLVFRHTLTSFMAPARVKKITYHFLNSGYYFSTNERISNFLGFLAVDPQIYLLHYRIKTQAKLINISQLTAEKIEIQEYLENKPVRYNEGSLVQELEKLGVGRPSTYNTFGRKIQSRKYAELNPKGQFVPTPLGFA
ncbi:6586_t:CDS:2, partial [Gigaspora margarita]